MAKAKKILSVILFLALLVGVYFAGYFTRNLTEPDLSSLRFVLDYYKKYYLEESDDYVEIMANSLLDRYSAYYSAEEYKQIRSASQGIRAGIGLSFYRSDNAPYIASVSYNSPAEKAGIRAGGVVTAIGKKGESKIPISDYPAFSEEIGKFTAGEEFELTVSYGEEERSFSLAKREYRETYVRYCDNEKAYRYGDDENGGISRLSDDSPVVSLSGIPENTVYLKYTSFNGLSSGLAGSCGQFADALGIMKENGKHNLVIDLRGNGGGFLDIMCGIAAHLIDGRQGEKQIVVRSVDKKGNATNFFSEKVDYGDYGFESIVFLADENSASASEALMGAVLDYDSSSRVKVVLSRSGTEGNYVYKSYGKGIMQTTYENYMTGEAIKLTTAKLYWPLTDTCIHGKGITKQTDESRVFEPAYGEGDYELAFAFSLLD